MASFRDLPPLMNILLAILRHGDNVGAQVLAEFGLNEHDELVLIDEVLTADSSRFWPADSYRVGMSPPSFDKQYVRDYLEQIRWNKQPPVPALPDDVVERTREKYREAFRRLAGRELE